MIQKFIDVFMSSKDKLEAQFSESHPEGYLEVVRAVVSVLPDLSNKHINELEFGSYQGDYVYVISNEWEDKFWYVIVGYGSCSGCDTLQSIGNDSFKDPTVEQVKDYMTLALHIVQGLREMES